MCAPPLTSAIAPGDGAHELADRIRSRTTPRNAVPVLVLEPEPVKVLVDQVLGDVGVSRLVHPPGVDPRHGARIAEGRSGEVLQGARTLVRQRDPNMDRVVCLVPLQQRADDLLIRGDDRRDEA
jgi:hypothetical protein